MEQSRLKENASYVPHYESEEIKSFAEKSEKLKKAFFDPTIGKFLKTEAPGKKVLDIGCGTGDWCCKAAQYGAMSVDGFDIQEEMVKMAKRATSQFNTVNIQLGDAMNMPYDDNTFDIALSIYVTCALPIETLPKHFSELHRVLVPGGKALVLNKTDAMYQRVYLTSGANDEMVQKKIDQILARTPKNPTRQQINEAFDELREIYSLCFTYKNDLLLHVKDVKQLVIGQAVLIKTPMMIFPVFYYSDQFLIDQTTLAGLHIDEIENVNTEERRIMHNTQNPEVSFSKDIIDHPFCLLYHISKP